MNASQEAIEHREAIKRAAQAIVDCKTAEIRGESLLDAEKRRNEVIYQDFPSARTELGAWNYVVDRATGVALGMLIEERERNVV